jgi:hypothetical protein
VAVTAPLYVPAMVGVPLMVPAADSVRPGGNEPAVSANAMGPVPVAV